MNYDAFQEPPDFKLVCIGDSGVGKTCLFISSVTRDFPDEYIPTVFDNYVAPVALDDKEYRVGLWDTIGTHDFTSRLRPLAYPYTDVFLVCFSLVDKDSLANVKTQWVPEMKLHCPEAKFILVGLKNDLVAEKMRTGKSYLTGKKEYARMHRKIVKFWVRNCSSKIGKFDVSNITHKNYPNDLIKMITNFSETDDLQKRVSKVYKYLYGKNFTKPEHVTQKAIDAMIKDVKSDDYISCSALTGDGIDKVFEIAVRLCIQKNKPKKKCVIL